MKLFAIVSTGLVAGALVVVAGFVVVFTFVVVLGVVVFVPFPLLIYS